MVAICLRSCKVQGNTIFKCIGIRPMRYNCASYLATPLTKWNHNCKMSVGTLLLGYRKLQYDSWHHQGLLAISELNELIIALPPPLIKGAAVLPK